MASISLRARPSAGIVHAAIAFGAALAAMVLIFLPAWQSMAGIWWHNETYTHGMLVPLVTLWLAWRERETLVGLAPKASLLALPALALCSLAWLAGYLAGVNALQHFAVVGMVPALFVLCFGWRIAWRIAFPLAFLFFAVPFGEFLMPWLMDRTADFTIAAVQLSGVPVLREGRNFVLPSGSWSVVEACSGLRYLLAAIPLGLLYGYLNFKSIRSRSLYLGIVLLIALVANWMRAYLIVMLGHISDMKLAAGVDHLVYGWLFFGVVMAVAFWIGSKLPDFDTTRPYWRSGPPQASNESPSRLRLALAAAAGVLVLAIASYAASAMQASGTQRIDLATFKGDLSVNLDNLGDYRPTYQGARSKIIGASRNGAVVGVGVYQYFRQQQSGEMINTGNSVMPRTDEPLGWSLRRQSLESVDALPGSLAGGSVNEYEIERNGQRWLVWEWFWVNGKVYADPRRVKLATAASLFAGRGDESLALVIWTPVRDSLADARGRVAAEAARLSPTATRAGLLAP